MASNSASSLSSANLVSSSHPNCQYLDHFRRFEKFFDCLMDECWRFVFSIWIVNCILWHPPVVISQDIVAEFVNPNSPQDAMGFEKMVIDPSTGRLYVGAVNNLYELYQDSLKMKQRVSTGPSDDSVQCPGRGECNFRRSRTNAHMKALAIYGKMSKLIECTSLFQGRCRLRNLYDIGQTYLNRESQPIVANNPTASTVIFIASGPKIQPGSGQNDRLVPTVASLSLDTSTLFSVAVEGVSGGTELKLEQKYRSQFRIDYIGGFTSGRFAYFATRQPKNDVTKGQWPTVSKLVRVCTDDAHFWSYTEVPIECRRGNILYNLIADVFLGRAGTRLAEEMGISTRDNVLYATFVLGLEDDRSALCVYSMKQIEQKFLENIELCYRGETFKNLAWLKSTDKCQPTKFSGEDVVCGKDVNINIGGEMPIEAEAALVSSNERFISVVSSITQSATVVFIGTHDGRLIKTVVEHQNQAFTYRSLELTHGLPILPDMEMDVNGDFLYVLSTDSVIKVAIGTCVHSDDCSSCLEQKNPYCGWCVPSNRCTSRLHCPGDSPTDWQSSDGRGRCTLIASVDPPQMQITAASFLQLTVEHLSDEQHRRLVCEFSFPSGGPVLSVEAKEMDKTDSGAGSAGSGAGSAALLRCPTPSSSRLPLLNPHVSSITAQLSIRLHGDSGARLASTNFTFYDCGHFRTCDVCTSSLFPCDWCVQSAQCVAGAHTENRCRTQHIVNGIARIVPSRRQGTSFCPRIESPLTDLYIPSGTYESVSVMVTNLLDSMIEFQCRFHIGHSIFSRPATRISDTITCDSLKFEYFGSGMDNGTEHAVFEVLWSGGDGQFQEGHRLGNAQGIRVVMYKCESLAFNCGLCLSLNSSLFSCGWCSSKQLCTDQRKCLSLPSAGDDRKWLNQAQLCPTPVIIDFHPKKGPISGGTKVTIEGINLGRDYVDVSMAVSIANVKCVVIPELYVKATEIVCITKKSVHGKPASNPIIVKLKDDLSFTAISTANFNYVEPTIVDFQPRKGPRTGGTDVVIRGIDLDAGSEVTVEIASRPCLIGVRNDTVLVCRTGPSSHLSRPFTGHLRLVFDDEVHEFVHLKFRYEDDVHFTSVIPERTIVSGGITLEVRGSSFDLVQRPHMVVMWDKMAKIGPLCRITSSELMHCRTPELSISSDDRFQPTVDHPIMLDYGFQIDGFRAGNISRQAGFSRLSVFPDPSIDPFLDSGVKVYRLDDYLTINGRLLNSAAREIDIRVWIGKELCNLTALASRALTCQPPIVEPEKQSISSPHPEVVVTVGHRSYQMGYLSYDQSLSSPLSLEIILAISGAILIFVVAFVLLSLAYRRKTSRHSRQMKSLKIRMDTIEMKVASECKEAFAELQTSMSAITANVNLGTPLIPFWSYRDYVAQVLFPNSINHPVLRDLEVESVQAPRIEAGLRVFNQLLMNKTFLLCFIRTMEANKYFLSKDRVYVGSLLMVVLHEKMDYCTDILKTLLEDLIERTIERRFQPKILFRRSESVAERMLAAWFTFLMHGYLLPLFLLYYAIKQQMEKGPQDALTLEARYSLSEEKLLRSTFEFRELTVFVAADSGPHTTTEFPVRVLDCDTVSQVKEKCLDAIYRTTPYSQRPTANYLDLEWKTGLNGRSLLQDVDSSSKLEPGGWRRLNTLAHYNIPGNSSLALLPRQASLYNLSLLSDKSGKSSTFSLKNSPTLARPFANIAHHNHNHHNHHNGRDIEAAGKLYHLAKPTEHGPCDQQDKLMSEIYLTRLLTMKGTLQKFIEDMLEAIFSTTHRGSALPMCVKFMFDFMDEQALIHGITDREVVHTWKSNALPLRFWVNLLKNPQFLFDIQKPTRIEGCLSVVAQTLMDACSTQDHHLTKDSPSSKLLFAKDIYQYRDWVDRYYEEIKQMPTVSDQEMNAFLAEQSRGHCHQLHVFSALNELYKYLDQYRDQIGQTLDEDEFAHSHRLPSKFRQMLLTMDSDANRV